MEGDGYEIESKSVSIKESQLTAKILNPAAQKDFDLAITAYDGIVRVIIEEPDTSRFKASLGLTPIMTPIMIKYWHMYITSLIGLGSPIQV